MTGQSLVYTPALNFNGADSFIVDVTDGNGGQTQANVRINISPVNDTPIANGFAINVVQDTIYTGNFDVTDADSDAFVYEVVAAASKGIAIVSAKANRFSYTPNALQVALIIFLIG